MASFGLLILTVLILFVIVIFFAGFFLDWIRPSAIQIQLLGVHFSLFGAVLVLAFDARGYGFVIGLIGFCIGVFGSFIEPNSAKNNEQ